MVNYRTNIGTATGVQHLPTGLLAFLGGIFLFIVWYATMVNWENSYWAYGLVGLFSLTTGLLWRGSWKWGNPADETSCRYHQIFERDSAIIQLVFHPSSARFSYVSPNIQQILGYRAGEVGFPFFESCFKKEEHQAWMKFFDEGAYRNQRKSLELKMATKYGELKWMSWMASLIKNKKGGLEYILFSLTDISERKEKEQSNEQYLRELEQIIAQAQQPLISKNELRRTVGIPDLREPLRSVSSYVKLLESRMKNQTDPTGMEFLGYVHNGLQQINELVDGADTMVRPDQQPECIEQVDLNLVVEKIKKKLGYRMYDSGAILYSGELPSISADPFQMEQLFQNLIENGLTYNQSRTPIIKIDCELMQDEYLLTVEDNGLGIKSRHHNNIFNMFTQVHPGIPHQGTGIGLAICKRICEIHRGKIWASSPGEGRGSTFFVQLPQKKLAAAAREIRYSKDDLSLLFKELDNNTMETI